MMIRQECKSCGTMFDFDAKSDAPIKCDRCLLLEGTDIKATLKELRKNKVPGQEPIYRMIEVLNEKIEANGQVVKPVEFEFKK